jgi:hypothetical protein
MHGRHVSTTVSGSDRCRARTTRISILRKSQNSIVGSRSDRIKKISPLRGIFHFFFTSLHGWKSSLAHKMSLNRASRPLPWGGWVVEWLSEAIHSAKVLPGDERLSPAEVDPLPLHVKLPCRFCPRLIALDARFLASRHSIRGSVTTRLYRKDGCHERQKAPGRNAASRISWCSRGCGRPWGPGGREGLRGAAEKRGGIREKLR